MTRQFGFRASRNLAEIENADLCWDNLLVDRKDLPLLIGTSAAGVTEGDYFNCKDLTTFLEPQISGLSVGAASGLTAMLGKISKNGDDSIVFLSGNTIANDRAFYDSSYDIISASTNSYFSPVSTSGYAAGAQYLIGDTRLPSLTVSGFDFIGNTVNWSNYFVKYRQYLNFTDGLSAARYVPLYLGPPTALSSNVLWLDSEFSAIASSTGNVSRWNDVLQRGSATQSDPTYRPTLITGGLNNKPQINFNGGGEFLNIGSIGGSIPNAATLVICVSISDQTSAGDTTYSLVSSLANISSRWRAGDNRGDWGLFTNTIISNFPTGMPANGTIVASVRASDEFGLEVRLNGVQIGYTSSYTFSNSGNFVIGVSDSISRSNALRGGVHSIALFDEVLGDKELKSQEEYFRWRYGFLFDPDAVALSYTQLLHSEQVAIFELENGDPFEAG